MQPLDELKTSGQPLLKPRRSLAEEAVDEAILYAK